MENEVIQILLDLARDNARHITVLNHEMGAVEAELRVITKLLIAIMVAIVGIFAGQVKNIIKK